MILSELDPGHYIGVTAPLAQLAEQLTLNQRVIGSSPMRGSWCNRVQFAAKCCIFPFDACYHSCRCVNLPNQHVGRLNVRCVKDELALLILVHWLGDPLGLTVLRMFIQ